MCPFNQPRNVGQHHFIAVYPGHTQVRVKGGKRIVGDFRPRFGYRGQKSGLSGIWHSDQTDVGNDLKPQPQPFFLSRPAGFGITRRLIGRALESGVASPAVTAFGCQIGLAGFYHVGQHRFPVFGHDFGSDRHFDDNVRRLAAVFVRSHAVLALFSLKMLSITEINQGIQIGNRFKINAAALAAVTAVRPAKLDILFPAERNAAGTAVARLHENLSLIQKFHNRSLSKK